MGEFDDFLKALAKDDFEERPVDIEQFVTSEEYLGLPPLSPLQYTMTRAGSQIYTQSTLEELYGMAEGNKRFKQTFNEVIMALGKGSGKDFTSTVICAYVVYLLLCLKEPARYYGKPPGDSIDIINIAINAQQASNVFFQGFVNRIKKSPWFRGKYNSKTDGEPARNNEVNFIKNINLYSGHSERESWEGYNTILVILDEISGFAIESMSGNTSAKTAEAIYKMYRGSVDSRFPDYGKVLLLSYPRYKDDFILSRYASVVQDVEVVKRDHLFKLNPDLPDGIASNELLIEWDEDHIFSYRTPRVFALKRPSWEVNPTRHIEEYTRAFFDDTADALMRFACMPPDAVDALFKNKEQLEQALVMPNPIDDSGLLLEELKPDPDKEYFIHVDLAQKHDRCAVAMAHVSKWIRKEKTVYDESPIAPIVIVDFVRWWTPTRDKSVDFKEVREFIVGLHNAGFNIKRVTFDRWNSHDMMMQLRSSGMNSEILSVAKKHYDDFKIVVMESRLIGPNIDLLLKELLRLRIIRDKVDHPRSGSKDLADAVCGAIHNSIKLSKRDIMPEVEVITYRDRSTPAEPEPDRAGAIISPPKREMPEELENYFARLRLL